MRGLGRVMEESSRTIEFKVEAEHAGRNLQNYLERVRGLSAKAVKKLKHQGTVLLNGQAALLKATV